MNQTTFHTEETPPTSTNISINTAIQNLNIFSKVNYAYLGVGSFTLILGYLFYVIFRQYDPLFKGLNNYSLFENSDSLLHLALQYSTPSLIHVVSLTLIHLSFIEIKQKNIISVATFWTAANIFYEIMQNSTIFDTQIISGTSDPVDMLFSLIGGMIAAAVSQIKYLKPNKTSSHKLKFNKRQKNILFSCVVLLGTGTMLGCDTYTEAKPIYLSYEELRSPLVIDEKGPLTLTGKPYIKESTLLINNRNNGIHIFDNSDPENPIYQKYINIPGNIDMEIKEGFLYADSYIDLLIIDINDTDNINLVKRHENFFAYNTHQSIPSEIVLLDLDISKGIVVDYEIIYSEGK